MDKRPKCKHCKTRFSPFNNNSLQKYCLKNDDCISAFAEFRREQKEKEWKQRKKEMKANVYRKTNKNILQDEINKIARLIDSNIGCISCIPNKEKEVMYAGGHFHNVGGNENIRYNLHNIHKQCNFYCNSKKGGNKTKYQKGIELMYGIEYLQYMEGLRAEYPELKIPNYQLPEKIKLARKIVRELQKTNLKHLTPTDRIELRDRINTRIGLYLNKYIG